MNIERKKIEGINCDCCSNIVEYINFLYIKPKSIIAVFRMCDDCLRELGGILYKDDRF